MLFAKKQLTRRLAVQSMQTIAAGAAAVIVIGFVTKPIVKIADSIEQERRMEMRVEEKMQNSAIVRRELEETGTIEDKIKNAFLTVDSIGEFISALENLSNQHSLQQSLKFGSSKPATTAGILEIEFTVQLNGNILTLTSYLNDFERLPYFAAVRGITVSAPQQGWTNDSTIALSGVVYVKK